MQCEIVFDQTLGDIEVGLKAIDCRYQLLLIAGAKTGY